MFWGCCCSSSSNCFDGCDEYCPVEAKPFSLPAPLPQCLQGQGFATGRICLGEIEVVQITKFERIWSCTPLLGLSNTVSFYRPVEIPDGFFCLGHYCQPDGKQQQLTGYVLVARDVASETRDNSISNSDSYLPALEKPISYTLVWGTDSHRNGCGCIWLPKAPDGYKSMGFVVTVGPDVPQLEDVRCVRADLTDSCEPYETLFTTTFLDQFEVCSTRPCKRGVFGKGVSIGTFFCCKNSSSVEDLNIACLKNLDSTLHAMPNLDQIHVLIKHYGPTVFFHPDESYLPSSVPWFFINGALLFKEGIDKGLAIDSKGLILPGGGENDGKFWLDLPEINDFKNYLKNGNIESAELYAHVKPALGGTSTDIAMWIFCPFNGPSTIKAGLVSLSMNRIGEHVGDWEHFTLRISNFTGELWTMYFSEHSGGEWVDACDLEFTEGNKPVVYSAKDGHASFPHPGCYIQGSTKLGFGVRNDCAQSKYFIDSSTKYQIIAAEHLGPEVVPEPHWLQYMREWGPTVVYDARAELENIISHLPFFFRFYVDTLLELFPTEIYGEEGPTGPKEKDNWFGDER